MVYVKLSKSNIDGKKYTAIFYDDDRKKIKTSHFGSAGMSDYTKHKDDERKQRYLDRHRNNENWNDYMTPGSLSKNILWNKPTINASYNDYLKKFNLKKY
jgi:hypothetical protein|tara:strand:+ start:1167 stop:1466 length:300 start_codon:yes stop_codon:yes gene_type:complete